MTPRFFALLSKTLLGVFIFSASLFASNLSQEYFVIGSTGHRQTMGPLLQSFVDEKNADTSHQNTFEGKAITLDIQPAARPGTPHIQADATTYAFSSGIKGVYFERFLTCGLTQENKFVFDYMERVIKNIAPAMAPQATLDIEWLPCITLVSANELRFLTAQYSSLFHGFFDTNTILNAGIIYFNSFQFLTGLPEDLVKSVQAESKLLDEVISFYCEKINVSEQDMKDHLKREIKILHDLMTKDYLVGLGCQPAIGIAEFKAAFENRFYLQAPPGMNLSGLRVRGQKLYNDASYMEATVFNYLLSDLTVLHNKEKVKSYFETQGFEKVTIERTESPHNHRENIWLIQAVKI